MDKIIIHDLAARGIIGVNTWERDNPQEILINIEIYKDLCKAGENDDLASSVDYFRVSQQVLAHAETSQSRTVEALAEDIANACLQEPGVEQVMVRVEKPGAVRFCKSVGVEILRTQEASQKAQ